MSNNEKQEIQFLNKRIIKIDIEKHNDEDSYYTYYVTKLFYINSNKSDEEIKRILNNISTVEHEVDYEKEIDQDDLYKKLAEKGIYPLEDIIEHDFDLKERY